MMDWIQKLATLPSQPSVDEGFEDGLSMTPEDLRILSAPERALARMSSYL